MKKNLLIILSVVVFFLSAGSAVYSKTSSPALTDAIKQYKAGNYSGCYERLEMILKDDPANALAYYYMGMTSAQLGRKTEAIENYEKAITLSPANNNLTRYARKGKRCLETPDKCEDSVFDSIEEEFILNKKGPRYTEKVRSELERLEIENFMRKMNRTDSIDAQEFKEFKDFSSIPTNDEIVAAMRTLQRAGFTNMMNSDFSDLSVLTGNTQQNSLFNMMGSSNMNPQLIQALLTNNMTQGF